MSSASWEEVVDSDNSDDPYPWGSMPRHIQYSHGMMTLDDDDNCLSFSERCLKEGRHRRTRSMSANFHDLLPSHMNAIVKADPTMDAYERYLEQGEHDLAEEVLTGMLAKHTNKKEQSKIYRAAAEVHRRLFLFTKANEFFIEAEKLDPELPQSYLDHAKLLNDIGRPDEADSVLRDALEQTDMSDLVTVKLLQQFEKRGKIKEAKEALGSIYRRNGVSQKNGPSLLEGVLFEARSGNVEQALNLFEFVQKSCSVKSGFYVNLSEVLRRRGYFEWTIKYAEESIEKFPTLPNNWNELLLLQTTISDVLMTLKAAESKVSPTAMTKLIMNAVVLAARMREIKVCRKLLCEKILSAPKEQVWKYYLSATFVELLFGDTSMPPFLISYAKAATPSKHMSTIIMAEAKVCESLGDTGRAEDLYLQLVNKYNYDWKIYLEYAMFLIRTNQMARAVQCVESGLEWHPTTGRLWALRVQLAEGDEQVSLLKTAIGCAPKSGEVWTEAARVAMNPMSRYFNLSRVEFFLKVAFLFTPQYIDIYIERIRYELLTKGLNANLDHIRNDFLCGDGSYGTVIYLFRQPGSEFTAEEFDAIVVGVKEDLRRNWKLYSRAIARSSFVVSSVRSEEERLVHDQSKASPFLFAFGLTSFLAASRNPEDSRIRSLVTVGSSGVFV